jgi:hypothetical protein
MPPTWPGVRWGVRVSRVDERTRRVGENEALFRTVNEKLEDLNEAFATVTDTFTIVCECGEIACTEQITLSHDDYRRLRADPTRFAIIRGHEALESEDVVERHETHYVVRKHEGPAARLAEDAAT